MRKIAALGVFLLGACVTTAPAPAPVARQSAPLTKADVQAGPPADIEQRVLAQLGDALMEQEFYDKGAKLNHALSDLAYFTRPTATGIAGVCRRDRVTFHFASADGRDRGASTPTRVDSLETRAFFNLEGEPSLERRLDDGAMAGEYARCSGLPEDARIISADDDEAAVTALTLLRRAQRASDGDLSKVNLTCDLRFEKAGETCASVLRGIDPGSAWSVERCDAYGDDGSMANCLSVHAQGGDNDYAVALFGSYLTPGLPGRIIINQLVILSHPRPE